MIETTVTEYRDLPVSLLFESDTNPRRHFDEPFLKELAESIRIHGVLSPLLVRPKGERFEIVFGAQRHRAAQMAGAATVPVSIRAMADAQVLEAQLVENQKHHANLSQRSCQSIPNGRGARKGSALRFAKSSRTVGMLCDCTDVIPITAFPRDLCSINEPHLR